MSVPSNEVLKGDPTIPVDQSIYEPSTTQKAPLGTRLKLSERVYYYAQASASLGGGTVVAGIPPTASHQSAIFTIAATSAGALAVSGTSSASVAANYYAEGYFGEALGAGAGEVYKVKGHAVGTAGISFKLYDALATTVTSGAGFWLYPNPYKLVQVGSQNLGVVVGVAPVNVTSGAYFWAQSYGVANPLHAAATPAGAAIRYSTTGGVVAAFNSTTNDATTVSAQVIGKNSALAATAGEANPVWLTIRP